MGTMITRAYEGLTDAQLHLLVSNFRGATGGEPALHRPLNDTLTMREALDLAYANGKFIYEVYFFEDENIFDPATQFERGLWLLPWHEQHVGT